MDLFEDKDATQQCFDYCTLLVIGNLWITQLLFNANKWSMDVLDWCDAGQGAEMFGDVVLLVF